MSFFVGYISYLCDYYASEMEEALSENDGFMKHFVSSCNFRSIPVNLEVHDAAEMIIGKCGLSQRGFANLRKILAKNNVKVPDYKAIREYCDGLDVGNIYSFHIDEEENCACMGVYTSLKDTLQRIVSTPELYKKMKFQSLNDQVKLDQFLKDKSKYLYRNFDVNKRTIILRDTGDNFRASARFPTEQTSFSILNMLELVNNPYGQFISTLWRGKESRENIEMHVNAHYIEINEAVEYGITLEVDGALEDFNLLVLLVADLCFIKEIIGQCQCTSLYGCYHCKMPYSSWTTKHRNYSQPKTIAEMVIHGKEANDVLGDHPDHLSSKFKNFQQAHFGQWV